MQHFTSFFFMTMRYDTLPEAVLVQLYPFVLLREISKICSWRSVAYILAGSTTTASEPVKFSEF
jgi:hypothetical protein